MNRQQAENMLDAFIEIHKAYKTGQRNSVSVDKAYESMREVILDAMTNTVYTPITVQPGTQTKPWWSGGGVTVNTLEVDDGR